MVVILALVAHTTLFAKLNTDSLLQVAQSNAPDTSRYNAYTELAYELSYDSIEASIRYGWEALHIAIKLNDADIIARSHNSLGIYHYWNSGYDSSLWHYDRAIEVAEANELYQQAAATLSNQGGVFYLKSEYQRAMDNFSESIRYRNMVGDSTGMGACYGGMGAIHFALEEHELAYEFYEKALSIYLKANDRHNAAGMYGNLAVQAKSMGRWDEARELYTRSIELYQEIENKRGVAKQLFNLSAMLLDLEEYDDCKRSLDEALALVEQYGDPHLEADIYVNLARYHMAQYRYPEAIRTIDRAMLLIENTPEPASKVDAYYYQYLVLKGAGRYAEALEAYETYSLLWDTINDQEEARALIRQSLELDYRQELLADSLERVQQDAINAEELKRQQIVAQKNKQLNYVFGALALLLSGTVFFILRGYRAKQRANAIISEQKDIVGEKNREIIDSINYAQRIQSAILPSEELINKLLPQSFVLYKPKDIVAGDFYWLDTTPSPRVLGGTPPGSGGEPDSTSPLQGEVPRSDGGVLFAAADCTGHGVPGAMVSVVCHNAMNRAVREFALTEPGKILDKTRELVIDQFNKTARDVKDGMDIALCSLQVANENAYTLTFAGANNPLWIIRKDALEVEEIKSNKEPIGITTDPSPFNTHCCTLHKGDSIYIFSDGYSDQFGGPKGKKFKGSSLKSLLLSLSHESMNVQKEQLNRAFEEWRGDLEQIDDVCVIGVRL